ncbi:hypothetical protein ABT364_04315 [Massilia sp. SR12]
MNLTLRVIHIVADYFHMAIRKRKLSQNISSDVAQLWSAHHNGARPSPTRLAVVFRYTFTIAQSMMKLPSFRKEADMKSRQKTSKQSSGSSAGTRQSADQGSRSGAQPASEQSDTGRQAKTDKKTPSSRSGKR